MIWNILMGLGYLPFATALVFSVYNTVSGGWAFFDCLFLYSFLYWPTYIVGLILIFIAFWRKRQ